MGWSSMCWFQFSLVFLFMFFPSFPYCLWKPSPTSNKGTRLEEISPFLAVEGSRSGLVWIHHQDISSLYQAISQWQRLSCKRSSLWRTQGGGSAAPSWHMESPVDEEKGCCGFQLGSWGAWSGASACCRNRAGKQALCRLDLGHNAAERGSISVVIFETGCHFQGGWFAQVIMLSYCQRREYNPPPPVSCFIDWVMLPLREGDGYWCVSPLSTGHSPLLREPTVWLDTQRKLHISPEHLKFAKYSPLVDLYSISPISFYMWRKENLQELLTGVQKHLFNSKKVLVVVLMKRVASYLQAVFCHRLIWNTAWA